MTTFARLALVIQGKIPPCNWIERAFYTVINALKLPTVGASDKDKFLHTNASTGDLEWTEGGSVVPYDSAPAALGTASAGSSDAYARGDHVHDYPNDFKTALLQLAEKVAYIDGNGQSYYNELETALTHRVLSSISAVYTQSGTVYDTDSLDSLKTDLVVTATYDDTSTAPVPSTDYTLSGTLTVGTSTITVSYKGKTTTFTVTVTRSALWVFTNGYTVIQSVTGTTSGYTYRKSVAARACGHDPIVNNGYVFAVTDSSKYNLAVYGVANLEKHTLTSADSADGYGYANSGSAPSWSNSGTSSSPYIWLALKKMDDTAFTAEELENGASAVFTFTEGS